MTVLVWSRLWMCCPSMKQRNRSAVEGPFRIFEDHVKVNVTEALSYLSSQVYANRIGPERFTRWTKIFVSEDDFCRKLTTPARNESDRIKLERALQSEFGLAGVCSADASLGYDWLAHHHFPMLSIFTTFHMLLFSSFGEIIAYISISMRRCKFLLQNHFSEFHGGQHDANTMEYKPV